MSTRKIDQNELVVFIDAKPAEIIDVTKDIFLCFTGVTASFNVPFEYKQFKKTRSNWRKIRTVTKLKKQIQDGHFDIKAISLVGKMNGHYVRWACDSLNHAYTKIGAEWTIENDQPKSLSWKGHIFELKHALGISIYSSMLAIIGLRFAIFAKNQQKYEKLLFVLDNLPIDSAAGMELMKAISMTSDNLEMWKRNLEYEVTFQIANLASYSNEHIINVPGKEHPIGILSDWLSVSSLAKINPKQVKVESGFSDKDIDRFVELWEAVNSRRSFDLINVDDPEVINKVKANEKKRTTRVKDDKTT